jgi:hypothetical protein
MKSLEVSERLEILFKVCVLGRLVRGCCWLAFHKRVPKLLGTLKKLQQSVDKVDHVQEGCGSL